MNEFIKPFDKDKIKISFNKSPIEMEKFLSFLTVDTERSIKHFGSDNGWTLLLGCDGLEIHGGKIALGKWPNQRTVEYLDSLRYGKNLDNPYNNFVNPFYLFPIMTDEGKKFFLNYYGKEIKAELESAKSKALHATNKLTMMTKAYIDLGFDTSVGELRKLDSSNGTGVTCHGL